MNTAAAVAAIILLIVADGWYCFQISRGTIAPALATWLIFGVATTISLLSYLKHPRKNDSFAANIGNRIDPVVVWIIVAFIVFSPKSDKSLHAFDISCLVFSGMIVAVWTMKSISALTANLLIQFIMLVSYLPTYHRMIHEGRNTESFLMWSLSLLTTVFYLIPPLRMHDRLGILYAGRGIASIALILLVMAYFQFLVPH